MVDLAHQQPDPLLAVAPLGHVGRHGNYQPSAGGIPANRRRAESPGAPDAGRGADDVLALVQSAVELVQPFDVGQHGRML